MAVFAGPVIPTGANVAEGLVLGEQVGFIRYDGSGSTRSRAASRSNREGQVLVLTDTIQQKRIAIAGGAGFIGSSLALRLADHNDVTLIDLSFDRLRPELVAHPNVHTVEADIRDEPTVARAVADADVFVHAAAILGVRRVIEQSRLTMEVNLEGTASALRAANSAKHLERFVFLSSSEVFGSSAFRAAEHEATPIGTIQDARWSYAISKLAGEHLTASYRREFGLPVAIVRPFNVFGPAHEGDHAVVRFISAALTGQDLIVHGDGVQLRSWCHIDDFLDGLELVMFAPNASGGVFNIGNATNTVTILDLAERIIRLSGSSSKVVHEYSVMTDIDVRVPSLGNARDKLGFEPTIRLDEGLLDTIRWYAAHPEVVARYT